VWERDSVLKQVPHLTGPVISELAKKDVTQVFDLMDMEDEDRDSILKLDKARMADVARFANRYPNVQVDYSLASKEVAANDICTLKIRLERDADQDSPGNVIAPFYPKPKDESWWLVIGDTATRTLLAIKKVSFVQTYELGLDFSVPENVVGKLGLVLYFMCDSYLGADQEFKFDINVIEGEAMDTTE
jgi:pre-mRNA-splicing helicase BRR2